MAKHLLLFRSDTTAVDQMAKSTPEQQQEGMAAWMQWFEKAGPALVDAGSPVTGGDGTIGGYSIVEAESPEALEALLADHPHRQVGTIDNLEFLPMPGM